MRSLEMQRHAKSLEQVEKKERKSLEEALKRELRVHARGGRSYMPSLRLELKPPGRKAAHYKAKNRYTSAMVRKRVMAEKDVNHHDEQEPEETPSEEFSYAAKGKRKSKHLELKRAFTNAAREEDEGEDQGSSDGPKSTYQKKQPEKPIMRYGRRRRKNKDLDKER